ncbi:MAG: acyl-CoA dehydrogenase family protein [Streptosporangiaceae bacterium]|jgi:alkylation response protein AidB-like acyl-CoA dehydrogenase
MTDWIARAGEVAEALAADAVERDDATASPVAEAELLRKAELPGVLISKEYGGAGEGWRTALAVVRTLARADGSIAQLLGYHYVNSANLWLVGDASVQDRWARPTAEHQWLWGDAVNPIEPDLTLTPDPRGYLLNGSKTFATGASVGDVIAVTGSDGADLFLLAVRANARGVEFGRDWDNLGMRLSASGSVTFHDVEVPHENVIGSLSEPTPLASAITPAIQAVFGHLYLGIAEGALATARAYTRQASRPWVLGGQASVTDEPYVLAAYGDHVARLAAVAALADAVAAELDAALVPTLTWEERGELAVKVAALKVVSTDTALDVTSKIFEVTGARSTANRYGFDRFWRDVRTHTLHDPVAYKRREVGLHYLTGSVPDFTLYT